MQSIIIFTFFTKICQNAPPLGEEGLGEGEKKVITPTLILPHRGGGKSLEIEPDAPPFRAGSFTTQYSIIPSFHVQGKNVRPQKLILISVSYSISETLN
jgi:hypothetical protein